MTAIEYLIFLYYTRCSSDADLVGNYDNEVTPAALVKRLWTTLYAFRFYNSDYIYIEDREAVPRYFIPVRHCMLNKSYYII